MNDSLVARQEALQRQNQELNQKVEAIEQRRKEQQILSASSSSKTSSLHEISNGDFGRQSKHNLEVDFSASVTSLDPHDCIEASSKLAKKASKEAIAPSLRKIRRKHQQAKSKTSLHNTSDNEKKLGSGDTSPELVRDISTESLNLETTVRYQKARLRVLQDEIDKATAQTEQLQASQGAMKIEVDNLKAQNAALTKKNQQAQQLLEKQRELTLAQDEKHRILEGQLSAAQSRVEETQRAEKIASQQSRSKEVRLNRALEEVEKLKAQLQDEKRSHEVQMVTKAEYDQVVLDNKNLDKQKGELLMAFKKQMKLIDVLRRQRVHMEDLLDQAAKMLSFTEAEFSKTLELG